jgi:undecaprenyl-diphosphatase
MLQIHFFGNLFRYFTEKAIKWFPYTIFVWALVVSYSRIYLGVHFPIDILVGAFVGSLLGVIFGALAKKVINKQTITS